MLKKTLVPRLQGTLVLKSTLVPLLQDTLVLKSTSLVLLLQGTLVLLWQGTQNTSGNVSIYADSKDQHKRVDNSISIRQALSFLFVVFLVRKFD